MIGQPHWLGPDNKVFAMVHRPPDKVRGSVVIVAPLGYEAVGSYPTLRTLGERLSDMGFLCLRVGFPLMSNSLAVSGEDQVPAWRETVSQTVAEARRLSSTRVAVVGLRFSATVAAQLAAEDGPDALVLWDPVVDGRRYVRGMRLLVAEQPHNDSTGDIVAAGINFSAETLRSMNATKLQVDRVTIPALVLQRSDASSEPSVAANAPGLTTVEAVAGTSEMLDTDAELAVVPSAILDRIGAWLAAEFPATDAVLPVPLALCDVTRETHGSQVLLHQALRVGPRKVFAVTTTLADTMPEAAVIFLNNGAAPNLGPGAAWLGWAADVALDGAIAVRLDVSGIGDTARHPRQTDSTNYPISAADDVGDVIDLLTARGVDRVALVGLCSGASLSFDAALARDEVTMIVAINPRFDKPFHDSWRREVRAAGQSNRFLSIPLSKSTLFPFFDKLPTAMWRTLFAARLLSTPTKAIEGVVNDRRSVLLVFGHGEWGHRALVRRAPKQLARLNRHARFTLTKIDTLEHNMFAPDGRRDVEEVVRHHLRRDFFPASRSSPHAVPQTQPESSE